MAFEKAMGYLKAFALQDRVMTFASSTATVTEAAQAVGCEPAHIAKTLSFEAGEEHCALIVCAGDRKIDNPKFKAFFHFKAKMLSAEKVEKLIGHRIGGVCPFGVEKQTCAVYLDVSLKRFEYIYPACGDDHSAVKLTPDELQRITGGEWIDVCRPIQE